MTNIYPRLPNQLTPTVSAGETSAKIGTPGFDRVLFDVMIPKLRGYAGQGQANVDPARLPSPEIAT